MLILKYVFSLFQFTLKVIFFFEYVFSLIQII